MRLVYSRSRITGWSPLLLFHHLVMDHVALEMLQHEMQAFLLGNAGQLSEPVPYRNYVAQTRSGRDEHESFFREMLGADR